MRAVVGVIVSFIAMGVAVFALSILPWFIFGVDRVLQPGTFTTTPVYDAYAIAVSAVGGFAGGWLCWAIGRSRGAVIILAFLSLAAGFGNHFVHHHRAEPGPRPPAVSVMEAVNARREPDWYTLLIPLLGAPAVLLGARRAGAR